MGETALLLKSPKATGTADAARRFFPAAVEVARDHGKQRNKADLKNEALMIRGLGDIAAERGMNRDMVEAAACWAISAQRTLRSLKQHKAPNTYPLLAAMSVALLNLDQNTESKAESVVASLLHEAVAEDIISLSDIQITFGQEAADLTDQVARLTRMGRHIRLGKELNEKDISFNQLQLEIAQEGLCSLPYSSRVVPIKFFDCLHGMRTLEYETNEEDKIRRALYADGTYIPLLRYYGWDNIREELERLVMETLDPHSYERIKQNMRAYREEGADGRPAILNRIEERLKIVCHVKTPIDREIIMEQGRIKDDYPIWKKMRRKQSEGTQEKIKIVKAGVQAANPGLSSADLKRAYEEATKNLTFSYAVRSDEYDRLFASINDKIGCRVGVVGGTDEDIKSLMCRFGERFVRVEGSSKAKGEEPKNRFREVPYRAYHEVYFIHDDTLGPQRVEIQAYKAEDAHANFSDHRAYKGRKGIVLPDVPSHLAHKRSFHAFQDAALVDTVAGRTTDRIAGAKPASVPFTPRHIIVVGDDGAFVRLSVRNGSDPTKPTYPAIGDFCCAVHTDFMRHAIKATVNKRVWDLTERDARRPNPLLHLNLMTGDHIVLEGDAGYTNLARWEGHLRTKSARELLGTMRRRAQPT